MLVGAHGHCLQLVIFSYRIAIAVGNVAKFCFAWRLAGCVGSLSPSDTSNKEHGTCVLRGESFVYIVCEAYI